MTAKMFGISAGRSYYAMFHAASAALAAEGLKFRSHGAVIGEFGRLFAKTGRLRAELHGWLIEASEVRMESDYWAPEPVSADAAEAQLKQAEEFVRTVEEFLRVQAQQK